MSNPASSLLMMQKDADVMGNIHSKKSLSIERDRNTNRDNTNEDSKDSEHDRMEII